MGAQAMPAGAGGARRYAWPGLGRAAWAESTLRHRPAGTRGRAHERGGERQRRHRHRGAVRDRRRDSLRTHQGQEHRPHRRPPHRHRHPAQGGAHRPRRGARDRRGGQRAAGALHLRVHHRRHRPHPRRHHRRCGGQGVRRRHRCGRARAGPHEGLLRAARRGADAGAPAHGAHPLRRRAGGEQRVDRAGLHARQRHRHGRRAEHHARDAGGGHPVPQDRQEDALRRARLAPAGGRDRGHVRRPAEALPRRADGQLSRSTATASPAPSWCCAPPMRRAWRRPRTSSRLQLAARGWL